MQKEKAPLVPAGGAHWAIRPSATGHRDHTRRLQSLGAACRQPTVADAQMSRHVTERSRLRDGRVVLWFLPMTEDPRQLHELARKVATAAANQIAAAGPTDREHRVAPSTSKPDRWSQTPSGHDLWGLTFILTAGIVIGLAIVAAGGWIF